MNIDISVKQAEDQEELGISDYQFQHLGCSSMNLHRNPASPHYTLKCKCGIEIVFEQHGIAAKYITEVVIDKLHRSLSDLS